MTPFWCNVVALIPSREHDSPMEPAGTDAVDRALLAALQADARIPQASLGARVGLSAAAVNRRMRRLLDTGVITRISAVLAQDRLDHPLTVIAQVEVESEQTEILDRTLARFTACP